MQVFAVSALTRYIRDLIDSSPRLQAVWVEGEVSNFRRQPSGHCYFTLKDAAAQLTCVWFAGSQSFRARVPKDGDLVMAHGKLGVYEARGNYQLVVNVVQPAGMGILQARFEELKARLERQGLFEQARKRPLPRMPRVIGVVTSPTGSVLHDVLNVIRRRFPATEIVVVPTPVQGDGAAERIVEALEIVNASVKPDVILLVRGGGSLEDLWCFNEESVARAIYASRAPVIAGVGHETDVTIADSVADHRAPTPSAAAEIAVPDVQEVRAYLDGSSQRLRELTLARARATRARLDGLQRRLVRCAPGTRIGARRQYLDSSLERIARLTRHRLALRRSAVASFDRQLAALSPLAVLSRGYAIVRHGESGKAVRAASEVYPGEPLNVRVADGSFAARADA